MACKCTNKCAGCPSGKDVEAELKLIDTCFEDVTITIPAKTPREAYHMLCAALGTIDGAEYWTKTYTLDGGGSSSASDLWPRETDDAATREEDARLNCEADAKSRLAANAG